MCFVAPSTHMASLREKAMEVKQERDDLRKQLDDVIERKQKETAESLEQLSLEMEEREKAVVERVKSECTYMTFMTSRADVMLECRM